MLIDIVTLSWGRYSCQSSTAITSCFSMIIHGPMTQGSVHNSWKLKMSQFFHVTHWACLGCSGFFGMLWTTFHRPQSTAWSTLCKWDVSRCMRKMVVTLDTDWFSDETPLFLKGICDQQMHICSPSHVKSIDWGLLYLYELYSGSSFKKLWAYAAGLRGNLWFSTVPCFTTLLLQTSAMGS